MLLLLGIIIGAILAFVFEFYKNDIDNQPKEVVKYYFLRDESKNFEIVDDDTEIFAGTKTIIK